MSYVQMLVLMDVPLNSSLQTMFQSPYGAPAI
jgi:hypothetical protein